MKPLNIVTIFNGTMKIKLYKPYYLVLCSQNIEVWWWWTMVISWKGFSGNINGLNSIIKKKDGNFITLKMNISFFF